jgi:hypothetical protein
MGDLRTDLGDVCTNLGDLSTNRCVVRWEVQGLEKGHANVPAAVSFHIVETRVVETRVLHMCCCVAGATCVLI